MTDITAEMVIANRKARGLSRTKYAELVGLTPTKVHNIEHGRVLRPEEAELLRPFLAEVPVTGQAAPAPPPDSSMPPPPPVADGPAPVAAPSGAPAPVVLMSPEEEEELGDADVQSTFGLPARYDFALEGYHVSNSELSCFKRCRRKWWLAYYRELRLSTPSLTGARAIGTRIHIALSAYYSSRRDDPREVLEATIQEDQRILNEGTDIEALTTLEKDADLARAMLEGYIEWLRESGADEGLDVVANETVVEVPFLTPDYFGGQPVALVGKMDLRLRRTIDGARLFLDHKTVGSLNEPLKTLHLDEQMLHYHLLEYLEYLNAGMTAEDAAKEHSHGGLYNMLRKVKRTVQAKPPFFDRVEVRHNIHELRSYYMRVFGEVQQILELKAKLDGGADPNTVAYPTPRRDCAWDCDFLAVCPMFDDGSAAEEMLGNYYERHDAHDHYYPYGEREVDRQDA